ncbi:MAG: alpha/beta hydrolase [Melioribacteraceae bacterium]
MKNIFLISIVWFVFISKVVGEEVSINVGSYSIKGTLEIPKADQAMDAVLIIAGSGPTDRDGNNRLLGSSNAYKMISELLLKQGIASLRYDKRGIGANENTVEEKLTIDMYINDAVEWIKYLKKDKRFSRIIIIGHSEGSLVGMIAARITDADKFISLCGAGKPIYKTIEEQVVVRDKLSSELTKQFNCIVDSLRLGHTVKNVNTEFKMLFNPSVQPYLISWFKYDPCVEIAKLKIPSLIIGGTTDIQIQVEDAEALSKCSSSSRLAIIEDMNHVLKEVPTLEKEINLLSYLNPELPLSYELSKELIGFLKE